MTVEQAIRNLQFDTVVHLAAVSAWSDLARVNAYDSSFAYTKTLISALARTAKQVNFIYISSAAAGPARRTLSEKPVPVLLNYASAKRDTEAFLLKQSPDIVRRLVILRLAETYGPNDDRLVTAGNVMEYIHRRLSFITLVALNSAPTTQHALLQMPYQQGHTDIYIMLEVRTSQSQN